MKFTELGIIEEIIKALKEQDYQEPTPIQTETIPTLLKGLDLLGSAQTGTGKTAAFAIPILQQLHLNKKQEAKTTIKVLVLTPTRELANQIGDNFIAYSKYLNIRTTVIFGGVSQNRQTRVLKSGVDVLVATPGRLLDLIKQGFIDLSNVSHLVLDEADQMLDMGFIRDVNKIISFVPKQRQTMLFSATMPKEIEKLSNTILNNPIRVAVTPVTQTLDAISQSLYHVNKKNKTNLLIDIIKDKEIKTSLVFSKTKRGANLIVQDLVKSGIQAQAIHGNKSQSARERALHNFKLGQVKVLVATDIAARGIDIDALSYVFNYDLPDVAETYIHRIGRTGRAGLEGSAIAFCDPDERHLLRDIEKHTKRSLDVVENHRYPVIQAPNVRQRKSTEKNSNSNRQNFHSSNNQGRKNTSTKGNQRSRRTTNK